MPCYAPLRGYKGPTGLVLSHRNSYGYDRQIQVPCGWCIGCRLTKAREWSVRLMHESLTSSRTSFLTLTYNNDEIPLDYSLNVHDWQLFAKRLRKNTGKFRFYQCGEYGSDTKRPHHHAIIFGQDWSETRTPWRKTRTGHQTYRDESLEECWGKGFVEIGNVSPSSIQYVAGYVTKKYVGEGARDHYHQPYPITGEMRDIKPEFATMSRRPGLGFDFLKKYGEQIYSQGTVIFNEREVKPPKYYDDQVAKIHPELVKKWKRQRRTQVNEESWERMTTIERCKNYNQTQRRRDPS